MRGKRSQMSTTKASLNKNELRAFTLRAFYVSFQLTQFVNKELGYLERSVVDSRKAAIGNQMLAARKWRRQFARLMESEQRR